MTAQPAPQLKLKRRSFLSLLYSHLMVALVAVTGVVSYIHWDDIVKYVKQPPIGQALTGSSIDQGKPAKQQTRSVQPEKEKTFAEALEASRKLFWANDPATVLAYEKLIAKNPDNAELKAELGNVYFKRGKKDQAANQYLQAGKLFAKQANAARVSEVAKILARFAPKKARELNNVDVKVN